MAREKIENVAAADVTVRSRISDFKSLSPKLCELGVPGNVNTFYISYKEFKPIGIDEYLAAKIFYDFTGHNSFAADVTIWLRVADVTKFEKAKPYLFST